MQPLKQGERRILPNFCDAEAPKNFSPTLFLGDFVRDAAPIFPGNRIEFRTPKDFHVGTMEKLVHTSFRQVKHEIIARIQKGLWPSGFLVPREIELVKEFGCSRSTVSRAMRELADEGLVERKRKAGTRVVYAPVRRARLDIPLIRKEIEATGAIYRYALIDRAIVSPPPWLLAWHKFPGRGKLIHLRCLHFANSAAFVFEDRWINLSAVPASKQVDFRRESPNEWLVNMVPFSTAEFHFFAEAASPEIGQFLSLNPGTPVFVAERSTRLGNLPITFAKLSYSAGYRMKTRLGN